MYCLLTGGRGFFGNSLVQYILDTTDWTIVCPVRGPKTPDRLHEIDQKDRVISTTSENIDIIIHAAANPNTIACINDPTEALESNVKETLKILEFAKTQNLKHFIFISTASVYGDGIGDENSSGTSINMYAATKIAGEQMCLAYFHSYGVPCSIARLGDVFGPRSQKERFPTVCIRKLLACEKINIHCDATGEVCTKNWIHSEDAADMILFIIRQPPGNCYNVTGSKTIPNLDFLKFIAKEVHLDFEYEICSENIKGRILQIDAPPTRLYSLGWRPKKSFEERIKEFVEWTLTHPSWIS
jgi:dTDP-glucose 4,6-dehydratase